MRLEDQYYEDACREWPNLIEQLAMGYAIDVHHPLFDKPLTSKQREAMRRIVDEVAALRAAVSGGDVDGAVFHTFELHRAALAAKLPTPESFAQARRGARASSEKGIAEEKQRAFCEGFAAWAVAQPLNSVRRGAVALATHNHITKNWKQFACRNKSDVARIETILRWASPIIPKRPGSKIHREDQDDAERLLMAFIKETSTVS